MRIRSYRQAVGLSLIALNPDHPFKVGGNVHWWWRDLRNKPGFEALLAPAALTVARKPHLQRIRTLSSESCE